MIPAQVPLLSRCECTAMNMEGVPCLRALTVLAQDQFPAPTSSSFRLCAIPVLGIHFSLLASAGTSTCTHVHTHTPETNLLYADIESFGYICKSRTHVVADRNVAIFSVMSTTPY